MEPPQPSHREAGWGADMISDLRSKYAQLHFPRSGLSPKPDVTAKVQVSGAQRALASPGKVRLCRDVLAHPPTSPQGAAPPRTPHRAVRLAAQAAAEEVQRSSSSQPGTPRKFGLADFSIGRVVGAGSFGRVYIAKRHTSGQTFAIKAISKAACLQGGQVKHVMDEKRLLARMKHPFVVQLFGTFQDEECVYMVMEFVPGGEFFTLMRDRGRMREEHARFYAAQVVLALDYLHSNNIVYRDLKPENLLVGAEGYLRLADMGFAKVVAGKTYTMCGTPDYMAPEIVQNQGHTKAVDWWSLGCVIYEMLYGTPPFYTGDAKRTYQKIVTPSSLVFTDQFSSYARDLISGLLQHNPDQRLGIWGQGVAVIKSHPWFGGLDWNHVYNKMYKPPHIRSVTGNDEAINFDSYEKLAPMQHQFTLTAEQQAEFAAF